MSHSNPQSDQFVQDANKTRERERERASREAGCRRLAAGRLFALLMSSSFKRSKDSWSESDGEDPLGEER